PDADRSESVGSRAHGDPATQAGRGRTRPGHPADTRTRAVRTGEPLMEASPGSHLAVRNLMKTYHGRKVVQDVSIDVRSGEVVGLLGPNGAGKTTCFYMIVGLVPSDGGAIELDGHPVGRLPIHRRARLGVSYLPQEASVFRKMTVEENILAVLELQRDAGGRPLSRGEIAHRLESLLT